MTVSQYFYSTFNVLYKHLQSLQGRRMEENFQNISDRQFQKPPYCTKNTAVPMKRYYLRTTTTNKNSGSALHENHIDFDVLFSTDTIGGLLKKSKTVTNEHRRLLTEYQNLYKVASLCQLWVKTDASIYHCRRNGKFRWRRGREDKD